MSGECNLELSFGWGVLMLQLNDVNIKEMCNATQKKKKKRAENHFKNFNTKSTSMWCK